MVGANPSPDASQGEGQDPDIPTPFGVWIVKGGITKKSPAFAGDFIFKALGRDACGKG